MKLRIKRIGGTTLLVASAFLLTYCGGEKSTESEEGEAPQSMVAEEKPADPLQDKGIGPISSVTLGAEVDMDMAAQGEKVYNEKCTACHKIESNYIGPTPKGIFDRRSPEWIMNMILNPVEMVQKNEIAKQLLVEYNGAPMAQQNLTEEEARSVLEYFRTL